jgi:hypothetical protein
MKALTITQPWAALVALGHKQIETRSWRTHYRGPLAIHAAKGFPPFAREFAAEEYAIGRLPERLPRGAIVAVVWLTDVRPAEEVALETTGLERRLGDFTFSRFAWMFDRDRMTTLLEPIFCTGALGLWTIPDDALGRLEAAIGEALS